MKINEQKTVLFLDLEKREAEVKVFRELYPYLGGKGVAVKLAGWLTGESPLILANGPFTLYFPYAAHTYTLFRSPASGQVEEAYVGGSFGAILSLAGYDALVIRSRARRPLYVAVEEERVAFRTLREDGAPVWRKEGRAGLRTVLSADGGGQVDDHFAFGTNAVGEVLRAKGLEALVISGSLAYPLPEPAAFEKVYQGLLASEDKLPVKKDSYPSCFGCPLGCQYAAGGTQKVNDVIREIPPPPSGVGISSTNPARGGEFSLNLSPFLVACPFIGDFYAPVPLVFSLLSLIGTNLTHEHLEGLPQEVERLRADLL